MLKNWCFQIVMLKKSLVTPVDCKEIKSVNPKENQPWIFIRRSDVEAETLILWPPDVKNQPIGKDSDAGKGWEQEKKGWQRMKCLDRTIDSMDMNLSKPWERAKDRKSWHAAIHGVAKSWVIQLSDWTVTKHSRHSRVIQY